MIDSNNPKIDVHELMEQVRLEVERCDQLQAPAVEKTRREYRKHLDRLERIEAVVDDARFQSQTSLQWPAKLSRFPFSLSMKFQDFILRCFRFLFKKQTVINSDFVIALKELLRLLKDEQQGKVELNNELDEVSVQLNTTSLQLKALEERICQLEGHLSEQQRISNAQKEVLNEREQALYKREQTFENSVETINKRTEDVERNLLAIGERFNLSLDTEKSSLSRVDSVEVKLSQVEQHLLAIGQRLHLALESEQAALKRVEALETKLFNLSEREQLLQGLRNSQEETRNALKMSSERHVQDLSYCKQSLAHQQEQLTILLKQFASPGIRGDEEALSDMLRVESHHLDAFYAAFEEKFRGSREDVLERLRVYLPILKKSNLPMEKSPIVDLGCGRGEWLELLSQNNYDSVTGIDINHAFLAQCRARSLDVIESDAIDYLASLEESTLRGITGFHLVEHLPLQTLIKLLDYSLKALKPGGIAIFETPNPANLLVGSCSFYLDPTHRNPLPSPMMAFLLESQGFIDVQILNLNQSPKPAWLREENELDLRLGELLYGPQDYAVVGYKA